jgi:hypothetical protein
VMNREVRMSRADKDVCLRVTRSEHCDRQGFEHGRSYFAKSMDGRERWREVEQAALARPVLRGTWASCPSCRSNCRDVRSGEVGKVRTI